MGQNLGLVTSTCKCLILTVYQTHKPHYLKDRLCLYLGTLK